MPRFPSLSGLETILWDYQASGHSSRAHLLKPLRPALEAQGLPTALQLNRMPDGRLVRYAGMVICRQRPGTAGGVTFMTLEDENRLRQPGHLETDLRTLFPAGQDTFLHGGHRKSAGGGRGHPSGRAENLEAGVGEGITPPEEPGLSLIEDFRRDLGTITDNLQG